MKIIDWYKKQSDTTKGFIIIAIICIIGIIIRWNTVVEDTGRGFEFFNKK